MMRETQAGRLDAQMVRAFVQTMSAFPVGSFVRLTNGAAGRGVRANPRSAKAPIVVPMTAEGHETDQPLDLEKVHGLGVHAVLT